MKKLTLAAVAATTMLFAGAADATSYLNGTFSVDIRQRVDVDRDEASATVANFDVATLLGTITYTGDINFGLTEFVGVDSPSTIRNFLDTNIGGSYSVTSSAVSGFLDKQLSKGSIDDGSAIATFFEFTAPGDDDTIRGTIIHDDGIMMSLDDILVAESGRPTKVISTPFAAGSGAVNLLYVATNSDPSVLRVEVAPVPLPAAGGLLVAGLAGLGFLSRRRKAA